MPPFIFHVMASNYLERITSQQSESAILVVRHFLNGPAILRLDDFVDVPKHYSDILTTEISKTLCAI